jgi:hypothetical protein
MSRHRLPAPHRASCNASAAARGKAKTLAAPVAPLPPACFRTSTTTTQHKLQPTHLGLANRLAWSRAPCVAKRELMPWKRRRQPHLWILSAGSCSRLQCQRPRHHPPSCAFAVLRTAAVPFHAASQLRCVHQRLAIQGLDPPRVAKQTSRPTLPMSPHHCARYAAGCLRLCAPEPRGESLRGARASATCRHSRARGYEA